VLLVGCGASAAAAVLAVLATVPPLAPPTPAIDLDRALAVPAAEGRMIAPRTVATTPSPIRRPGHKPRRSSRNTAAGSGPEPGDGPVQPNADARVDPSAIIQ
jgi:hypothetical protein